MTARWNQGEQQRLFSYIPQPVIDVQYMCKNIDLGKDDRSCLFILVFRLFYMILNLKPNSLMIQVTYANEGYNHHCRHRITLLLNHLESKVVSDSMFAALYH